MTAPKENKDRVWTDVTLLTMVPGDVPYGLVEQGAVIARGGKIDWLGPMRDLPVLPDNIEVISGEGHYLTPGLIDCHTHLIYGGSRVAEFEQRLQGRSYADI